MNQDRCAECGEPTVYEEELGSAICTNCGTLANPSQNVLASHLENTDTSGYNYTHYTSSLQGNTLKGRNGWALAGQDKEARDRRNTIAMHEFIRTLAGRLSGASITIRAQALFAQAMLNGSFRWGRKAKLLSGACLAIAFREANKSDSLRDIAYLLEEPLTSLTRVFTATISLLQLKLTSADPAQHLPTLQAHLLTLLREAKSVPHQLIAVLKPLEQQMSAIQRTANSLSHLLSRDATLGGLPSASTACAILMLALEGELAASLPQAGALAQALGSRVGASKAVVMQRYKAVYDLIEEYIRAVPWLDAHEKKGKGRSKVAKRVVVARGLKDVVQFQDELWQKKLAGEAMPVLEIEVESNDGDEEDDSVSMGSCASTSGMSVASSQRGGQGIASGSQRKKLRKTVHDRAVEQTSQFLLHPLSRKSSPLPSVSSIHGDGTDLLQHFFTADDSSLSHAFAHAPSRLQLLASSRGSEAIDDDELFDEGELDGFLRTSDEVEVLRRTFGWDQPAEAQEPAGTAPARLSGKKRKREDDPVVGGDTTAGSAGRRTKRVDMDALARLLDPDTHLGDVDVENDDPFGALGLGWDALDDQGQDEGEEVLVESGGDGEGEVLEEWRPLSPGGGGFDEDRYDV